jgi:hypothetical protein
MGPWAMSILNVGLGHFTCQIGSLQMLGQVNSNIRSEQLQCWVGSHHMSALQMLDRVTSTVGTSNVGLEQYTCRVGTISMSGQIISHVGSQRISILDNPMSTVCSVCSVLAYITAKSELHVDLLVYSAATDTTNTASILPAISRSSMQLYYCESVLLLIR